MAPKIVDVREAQTRLNELLSWVLTGSEVILVDGNTPLARLVPVAGRSTAPVPRLAGLHIGSMWTSDDFDEPLPDEFWTGAG